MNAWQRYRTLTFALLLFLASLVILAVSIDRSRNLTKPEKYVIELLSPVQKGILNIINWFGDIGRKYILLTETSEENIRLRRELTDLKSRLALFQESHLANQRLRRILEFKERSDLKLTAAEVVSLDPSGWFRTIIVDKGSNHGVTPGMAVVTSEGVVGRTVEVGLNYSKVLLLIDRSSSVDALIQRSRARGILKGSPSGRCLLEFVIRNADVKKGDLVISSGQAGVFPKGFILGEVTEVELAAEGQGMFQTIEVAPSVNFDRLEEVLLVLTPNPFLNGKNLVSDN